jgi:hypothetical protein
VRKSNSPLQEEKVGRREAGDQGDLVVPEARVAAALGFAAVVQQDREVKTVPKANPVNPVGTGRRDRFLQTDPAKCTQVCRIVAGFRPHQIVFVSHSPTPIKAGFDFCVVGKPRGSPVPPSRD